MAIITNNNAPKTTIDIEINKTIVQVIRRYCNWAYLDTIDSFIEKAARYIFLKDQSKHNNITFKEYYRQVVLKKKPRKVRTSAYIYVRTKPDVFEDVWESIALELEINPTLKSLYFLKKLINTNPQKFRLTQQRALTRRIKNWKQENASIIENFSPLPFKTPIQVAYATWFHHYLDSPLKEEQWDKISNVLSELKGNARKKDKDNRLFIEAVIYRYQEKIAWKKLPAHFGRWINVAQRHEVWIKKGVWDRIFKALENGS